MKNRAVLALCLIPILSFAWGDAGHKMVASIAKKNLNAGVEAKVQKFLGKMTFEQAAVWMDEIKKTDPSLDYMKKWHYVNIEKGGTYAKNPKGDIVSKLDSVITDLKNYKTLKAENVLFDLKVLFHLCGDMVQPLHSGYGSDIGGGSVTVTYKKKETNLHSVWDSGIIANEKITIDNCYAAIKQWAPEQKKKVQEINVMNWMLDSRSLLDDVYAFKNNTITPEYAAKNRPVIVQQISKGGVRLAAVLNETFAN